MPGPNQPPCLSPRPPNHPRKKLNHLPPKMASFRQSPLRPPNRPIKIKNPLHKRSANLSQTSRPTRPTRPTRATHKDTPHAHRTNPHPPTLTAPPCLHQPAQPEVLSENSSNFQLEESEASSLGTNNHRPVQDVPQRRKGAEEPFAHHRQPHVRPSRSERRGQELAHAHGCHASGPGLGLH